MSAPAATASPDLFTRYRVIDVDTHLTEPRDVWTSRVPSKYGDAVPHIERHDGIDLWFSSGTRLGRPGSTSMAGWKDVLPDSPPTYDDIHPSMYDAKERLAFMDRQGIHSQVLYPNVGGFGAGTFNKMADPVLALACVRAYNDFLAEWCSIAPNRLLPATSIPFWDLDAAVAEVHRAAALGHRGINFCNQPEAYGLPMLGARHWDPVWQAAVDEGLPICFHIGGGDIGHLMLGSEYGFRANFAKISSLILVDNMRVMGDLIFGGVCHRFPTLKFVSVESGVGWIPGVLEVFDWQWRNGGTMTEHPEYDLLPSEYFARQIYGCFWFERDAALHTIAKYPNNVLYETDYPHPTCQHPGPVTPAQHPRDYATDALSSLDDAVLEKVLHGNAASLYRVE